ncbi:MAG TPA: GNAT family N-acetyltransferase [Cyclobacteriaceae bacterium]|nr:GNAT family N-acetyltransferase [Cyclobacteriaceae bacterium]
MSASIQYQKLTLSDLPALQALISLYEDVFEMQPCPLPGRGYLQKLLQREGLVFFVALQGEEVVGGLTAHVLPSVYYESAELYIYDLAVKAAYQRQGIGKQLVTALIDYGKQQGYREVFVQADVIDQHALDFYKATGGNPEEVVHFTYPLA